jgi:hypothetical protein
MRVWNISHFTGDPIYIKISGKRCAPGKSIEIDSITKKESALVGSYIYVGDSLPEPKASSTDPMTVKECRKVLEAKDKEELLSLCKSISPAVGSDLSSKSKFWLASKIAKAIYSEDYSVDPGRFLWTNLWTRVGNGYRRD